MYFIIGICLNFAIGFCSAIVNPKIMAVIAGQNMAMECRFDNESTFRYWSFISTSHSTTQTLARNNNGNVRMNPAYQHFDAYIDVYGAVVLYTNATKLEDAGIYTCAVVTSGNVHQYSAQVIVLKSEPNCSTNFTLIDNKYLKRGDHIWMQCNVDYIGNFAPNMIWRQHFMDTRRKESGRIIADGTETVNVSNSSTVSSLVVGINFQDDASYFECEITFPYESNSSQEKTTKLPEYSHTWRSPAIYLMSSEETTDANSGRGLSTIITLTEVSYTVVISITWAAVVTVLFFLVVLIYCVKHRRKSTEKAIIQETNKIPKVRDEYEDIDNARIEVDVPLEILPREGPLPATGYSLLMPRVPDAAEAGYSKMIHCATSEKQEKEDAKDASSASVHVYANVH